uniref:Major facilitator superfamily domain-containing protein 12-like n=1 Tax=Hirondellea gigas TaxID=1518452 RepID=A0A2P2I6J1_9CRUS
MAALSKRTLLGYGTGHVLNDLCSSLWFTYLLIFLNKVERFPNALAGVVLLIGQITDGIATPFVGHEADRTDDTPFCIKYGRRKTWHLVGTFCVIVGFPFIFLGCLGCSLTEAWYQVFYLAPFVMIFQFGWAAVQISHLALIPQLTSDPHARTLLTAIRYGATVISNVTVYLVTWLVLGIETNGGSAQILGPNDAITFKIIVAVIIVLGTIFSIVFHLTVKEDNSPAGYSALACSGSDSGGIEERIGEEIVHHGAAEPSVAEGSSERLLAPGASSPQQSAPQAHAYANTREHMRASDWFKYKEFYLVAALYTCTRLFCNVTQAYIPIYLQDTLVLSPQSVAYIPLTMYVAGFVNALAIKPINEKFGRKVAFIIGCALGISACIWINFGEGDLYKTVLLYPVVILLGSGSSIMLVTSLSITADLIGNNIESGAFVYGAMSFCDKFANGIVIMIIQYYSPYTPMCAHCFQYYRYILTYVCGGTALLAGITSIFLTSSIIKNDAGPSGNHGNVSIMNSSSSSSGVVDSLSVSYSSSDEEEKLLKRRQQRHAAEACSGSSVKDYGSSGHTMT